MKCQFSKQKHLRLSMNSSPFFNFVNSYANCFILLQQESMQTLGILTAVVTNLIDKLSYLFVHVNGAATITAVLKTLAPALRRFIENAHTR